MSDYGLETGDVWDFGEHKCWQYIKIRKTTPKHITFELSDGGALHVGGELRRKVLRCSNVQDGYGSCFHIRLNDSDFRCFSMGQKIIYKP